MAYLAVGGAGGARGTPFVAGGGAAGGSYYAGGAGGAAGGGAVYSYSGGAAGGGAAGGGLDLGCGAGDGGNACFEPTGVEVQENWAYKGEGRGAYGQVQNIQYVGQGLGAYDREQVLSYTGYRCRAWCYFLMCFMVLALIAGLVIILLPSQSIQHAEADVRVTTPLPYDCQAGFWNWQKGWSASKKDWCCTNSNRGCATTEPFDCDAAFSNWKAAWSEGKKTYCCARYSRGCPPTTTDVPYHCHLGHMAYWSLDKKAYCCDHYSIGCAPETTSAPYDCKAGYSNWEAGWSVGKKAWCCQRFNLGCPTTEPYECTFVANWVDAWSLRQQAYCCKNHQRGCTTTTSLPFDCDAGYSNWAAGWSVAKQVWCCSHTGKACFTTTSLPFDCSAGLGNWKNAWSNLKKAWCCQHVHQGCEVTTTKSSLPYDCNAGYSNWQGWSINKKAWCCNMVSKGCPPTTTSAPYDCVAGYQNWELGWSTSKKHWCCAFHNKACDAFDCQEGLANWATAWGDVKKAWCCEKYKKGCKVLEEKACVLWGDPHVKTFDSSRSVFYSEGDFWIVKSPKVSIQGRFQATDWTKANDHTDYSSMTGLIVGGPFMLGHTIQVDSMEGKITCNGVEILSNFGQDTCGPAIITFDSQGALVDSAMAFLPHKVVHMKLPLRILVQANRWPNFMNAKVTMTKQEAQDGVCGNFNGNALDDQGKNLHQRYGHGVSAGERMFKNAIPWHAPQKMPTSKRCSTEKLNRAKAVCGLAEKEEGWSLAECVGDVCDEHIHGEPSMQAAEMKHMAQKALR